MSQLETDVAVSSTQSCPPGEEEGGDDGTKVKELDIITNSGDADKASNGSEESQYVKPGHVFAAPLLKPPPPPSSTATVTSPSSSLKSSPTPSSPSQQKQDARDKQEKYQQILSSLKYTPPEQGAPCADTRYNFEVLKNGTIVDSVKFSSFDRKGYYIIGRVPGCDIVAENPTVSRMHAILQFIQGTKGTPKSGEDCTDNPQETGLYLYDLKSTHGTFLNKNQLFPHKFYRVHVGHVLKFGSSQRMYIVNGPDEDEEEESEKTVTELLNERLQKDLERKRLEEEEQLKREKAVGSSKLPKQNIEEEGIDWGMAEDADEETDMRVNPFAIDYETSEFTLDNPKKSLRSWFDREGQDLEYEMREKGNGQYVCRIALPIDGPTDGPVFAESEVKGKKKEAAHDAAMKACRILDSHGLLRGGGSNQESSRKRKEKKWEDEDYYSSDEDTFLDRTGSIEKKREKRMRLAGKSGGGGSSADSCVLTYDGLCQRHKELEKEIAELQEKIAKSQKMKERADDGDVDIDDYLNLLKSGVFDVKKFKGRLREAQEEIVRTKKFMEIAKPAELPAYLQMKPQQQQEKKEEEKPPQLDESPIIIPQSSDTSSLPTPSIEDSSSTVLSPPPPAARQIRKAMVGPRKPPQTTQPKMFGLITPANFAAMKAAGKRPPPSEQLAIPRSPEENEDDDALEEMEEDELGSSEEDEEKDGLPTPVSRQSGQTDEKEDPPADASVEFEKPAKKKRQRFRNQQRNKQGGQSSTGQQKPSYQDDANFSEWLPPTGQSGDGRTTLNDKLGY